MTVEMNDRQVKREILIIVLSVILAIAIVLTSAYLVVLKIGEIRLKKSLTPTETLLSGEEYGDEADAYYDGNAYEYNEDLVNILLIGVDKDKNSKKAQSQADVLYLVSIDIETQKANILAISRNTLADIDIYDMNGEYFATDNKQICYSFAYGKDGNHSSELTAKAVSRLLYNVNINGYYTIYMDAIDDIVNAVGGVSVTIPEDMTSKKSSWKKGKTVLIKGSDARLYLTSRGETNHPRYQRHMDFITKFIDRAKTACLKDLSLPLKMYNKLASRTVTNVDSTSAVYLASEAVKASFKIHQIPGKSGFDGTFETFEVDEEKLYKMVLDVFYKKIKK